MKKLLAILLAVICVLACFTACTGDKPQEDITGNSTSAGTDTLKVPEEDLEGVQYGSFSKFTAIDLAGNKFNESIFKGKKLTMVNIWATFCGPCINEMPDLEMLSKEYADKDFQIIGIVCDVSARGSVYDKTLLGNALDIVEETGVTYTSLLPSESLNLIKLSEVYSVPETIFVDENGNIVGESYIGSRSLDTWKMVVDEVFASLENESQQ